jgi:phosphoserine phosphatase
VSRKRVLTNRGIPGSMEARKVRPLVVFDMDGVLVRERSSWRRIHDAIGTQNEDSFDAYMRNEIDDMEFMARDIDRWMQKDPDLDKPRIEEILDSSDRMEGFPELPLSLARRGIETIILSGGLDILAEKLAVEGGMKDHLANGVEFDNLGRLTGQGILRVPLRDKGSVLEAFVKEKGPFFPVISIGDSPVDITMFERSDLSIAFRPEYPEVSSRASFSVQKETLDEVGRRLNQYIDDIHHKLL